MPITAIALGSNLGDRHANLATAITHLRTLGSVTAISTSRDTPPVGYLDQPNFLNAAVLLETAIPPLALLRALLNIERQMGRDRSATIPAKGPRLIDLDLILYDQVVLDHEDLTLPHPAFPDRPFVLEPLAELAPTWLHPTLSQTIADLAG